MGIKLMGDEFTCDLYAGVGHYKVGKVYRVADKYYALIRRAYYVDEGYGIPEWIISSLAQSDIELEIIRGANDTEEAGYILIAISLDFEPIRFELD